MNTATITKHITQCPTCGTDCTIVWSGLELVQESGDETLATKRYVPTKVQQAAPELLESEKTNLATIESLILGMRAGTASRNFILQTLRLMRTDTETAIKKATE